MRNLYFLIIILFISFNLNAQIIDFPDANFKNALVNTNCVDTNGDGSVDDNADINNDGEISVTEAEALTGELHIGYNSISSLNGIEYFINLTELWCANNLLTEINIGTLNNLTQIRCSWNQLTDFDISNLPNLEFVSCRFNQIESINTSGSINISYLSCRDNQLTTLDTSDLTSLTTLLCQNNMISSLNLTNNPIVNLGCNDNLITSLDLTNQSNIDEVRCENNQLTELLFGSVPNNGDIFTLNCSNNLLTELDLSSVHTDPFPLNVSNNQLTTLILKNGVNNIYDYPEQFGEVILTNNPDLAFICVDPREQAYIEGQANSIPNCVVSSYCNFFPGGEYFVVDGNVQSDSNNNGCDNNDMVVPNLNFTVTSGSQTGSFITNSSGDYFIPVQNGSHTITPTLENSDYYTITPSSLTVEFPEDGDSMTQDFCLTSNGAFNDLEINLIPLDDARPGFDANYKLVYKNKGTTTLSGSVDLTFQDDIMDLVSANPTEDSQATNVLSWNFTDLNPFENRAIFVTINMNSPMETPPLNGDDVLVFDASVNSSETDETPSDNSFTLNQTVVNSFDPNDKTCLEGDVISPDMVGDYVHYRIRFENTGSASAINVVIKDDIDRSKLDLSTLVLVDSSHELFIRTRDFFTDYYVEFIFENIDLPFDDANNDGYVVFKIKTLDTLELNDTFENEAEIYFDFNFPIITNIAETTVSTLSTEGFILDENAISLYPNPTQNTLYLKSELAIKNLIIYDIIGRRIQEIVNLGSETTIEIDTKALLAGTYFIEIKTETSEIVKAFIKE